MRNCDNSVGESTRANIRISFEPERGQMNTSNLIGIIIDLISQKLAGSMGKRILRENLGCGGRGI